MEKGYDVENDFGYALNAWCEKNVHSSLKSGVIWKSMNCFVWTKFAIIKQKLVDSWKDSRWNIVIRRLSARIAKNAKKNQW